MPNLALLWQIFNDFQLLWTWTSFIFQSSFLWSQTSASPFLLLYPLFASELRCGKPSQLKLSQVYPRRYGQAVCRYHKTWMVPWVELYRSHNKIQIKCPISDPIHTQSNSKSKYQTNTSLLSKTILESPTPLICLLLRKGPRTSRPCKTLSIRLRVGLMWRSYRRWPRHLERHLGRMQWTMAWTIEFEDPFEFLFWNGFSMLRIGVGFGRLLTVGDMHASHSCNRSWSQRKPLAGITQLSVRVLTIRSLWFQFDRLACCGFRSLTTA